MSHKYSVRIKMAKSASPSQTTFTHFKVGSLTIFFKILDATKKKLSFANLINLKFNIYFKSSRNIFIFIFKGQNVPINHLNSMYLLLSQNESISKLYFV